MLKYPVFPTGMETIKNDHDQKPNKQPDNPENYRPIALINYLGKILERIINKRIYNY